MAWCSLYVPRDLPAVHSPTEIAASSIKGSTEPSLVLARGCGRPASQAGSMANRRPGDRWTPRYTLRLLLTVYLSRMVPSGNEARGIPHGPHGRDSDRGQRPSACPLRERNGGPGLGRRSALPPPAGVRGRCRLGGRSGGPRGRQRHPARLRTDSRPARGLLAALSSRPGAR